MWTRETKDLKSGFYWFRFKLHHYNEGKEVILPIQVIADKHNIYPETLEFGNDCFGPSLYTSDMEKEKSWIWDEPITHPTFPAPSA
jgi:hypothetical protein